MVARIPLLVQADQLHNGRRRPERLGHHRAPLSVVMERCQPAAARVTIPNAAHQMSQMNPAAVNAALSKFFLE